MTDNIEVFCHSSIKITGSKIIYIDPFKIDKDFNDAGYVFCTHSHYDHFSPEDIDKVIKRDTKLVMPKSMENEVNGFENEVLFVEPDKEYDLDGVKFRTTYSYNKNKAFHPKESLWVGYIIEIDNKKYYIAGDTDNISEIQNIECDVALIPIGGTYTMNYEEAANLANSINAKVVIPTHYGCIVGDIDDGERFKSLVVNKEVVLKIK